MSRLLSVISAGYKTIGFDKAAKGDRVFEQLVTARIIEPGSVLDCGRVLTEAGLSPVSYPTLRRRLPRYAELEFRQRLSGACAASTSLGPAALLLYDVTTLFYHADQGDGFRESGYSKERRLEPQITVGVRHEALCCRREVGDLPRLSVAGERLKLRAAGPAKECAGWVASGPDKGGSC